MKKLLALIAFIAFISIFSSCQEEEITPQDHLQTEKNVGQGSGMDDPGQWE